MSARDSGAREIRIEDLVGRPVVDRSGKTLGRLSEVRAEPRRGGLEITGVMIGARGWLERLAMWTGRRRPRGWFARWDQLDLADLDHPRVTCLRSELALDPPRAGEGASHTHPSGAPRLRLVGERRRRIAAGRVREIGNTRGRRG